MLRTYPLHPSPAPRPESLRQILRRIERELADDPSRQARRAAALPVRRTVAF